MIKENYYSNKMAGISDKDLMEYIENKSQYNDEAILAAIWELEKRKLASDEILELENLINQQKLNEQEGSDEINKASNLTLDPNAPLLYSSKFILIFGTLFSVFGGGILIALNFSRLNKPKHALLALFFSLSFTIIQLMFFSLINVTSAFITAPVSLLGIYLLDIYFWKRSVPHNLKFRKRDIKGALIIAVLISLFFVYLIFQTIDINNI